VTKRALLRLPSSIELDPVIEAYKKDVDRTLLRENLKLTPTERIEKLAGFMQFVEEMRRAGREALGH
jgi:hypothetical protein